MRNAADMLAGHGFAFGHRHEDQIMLVARGLLVEGACVFGARQGAPGSDLREINRDPLAASSDCRDR